METDKQAIEPPPIIITRTPRSTVSTRFIGASGQDYKFVGELGYGFGRNVCKDAAGRVFFMKVMTGLSYRRESEALAAVNAGQCYHFPKLHDMGFLSTDRKRKFIVIDLLGDNLSHAMTRVAKAPGYERGFTVASCLALAMQTLNAIEELHHCGFLSMDVKPDNFVHGRYPPNVGDVYLIDFSISRRFRDDDGRHVMTPLKKFCGTLEFCSIAQHEKQTPSRVDDLEGWFYTMLYLIDGELEWHRDVRDRLLERIKNKKRALRERDEIGSKFPVMMKTLLQIIGATERTAQPDYRKLYDVLEAEMRERGTSLDVVYDWETVPGFNPDFLCFGTAAN